MIILMARTIPQQSRILPRKYSPLGIVIQEVRPLFNILKLLGKPYFAPLVFAGLIKAQTERVLPAPAGFSDVHTLAGRGGHTAGNPHRESMVRGNVAPPQ